jgi:hypothetical protein
VNQDTVELYLNAMYRATLCITGVAGLPDIANAGNVLREHTTLKLSVRIPPGVNTTVAEDAIVRELTRDVPYNAHVDVEKEVGGPGFFCPKFPDWLQNAMQEASTTYFGKDFLFSNAGGTIPLLAEL